MDADSGPDRIHDPLRRNVPRLGMGMGDRGRALMGTVCLVSVRRLPNGRYRDLDRPAEVASPRHALVSSGQRYVTARIACFCGIRCHSTPSLQHRPLRRTGTPLRRTRRRRGRTGDGPPARRAPTGERVAGEPARTTRSLIGTSQLPGLIEAGDAAHHFAGRDVDEFGGDGGCLWVEVVAV